LDSHEQLSNLSNSVSVVAGVGGDINQEGGNAQRVGVDT